MTVKDFAAIPDLVFLRRLHILAWLGTHPEFDLAHKSGNDYTAATCGLQRTSPYRVRRSSPASSMALDATVVVDATHPPGPTKIQKSDGESRPMF
ncbi:hypothetical protein ACLBYD_30285 [Rhodococcus sp. C26F]